MYIASLDERGSRVFLLAVVSVFIESQVFNFTDLIHLLDTFAPRLTTGDIDKVEVLKLDFSRYRECRRPILCSTTTSNSRLQEVVKLFAILQRIAGSLSPLWRPELRYTVPARL
jgi:hypothetical protein